MVSNFWVFGVPYYALAKCETCNMVMEKAYAIEGKKMPKEMRKFIEEHKGKGHTVVILIDYQ